MRRLIPITLAALAIALSGCGYSLRSSKTPSLLSKKGVRRIYVRPMTNGTTMYGNITTSRIGTIGSWMCSYFSLVLMEWPWLFERMKLRYRTTSVIRRNPEVSPRC